jgi:DNA mismatch repair protein MutS
MVPGECTTGTVVAEVPARVLSVLFPPDALAVERPEVNGQPEYFSDLNLDQFVTAVTGGREEYELEPFFFEHLEDPATISFRQEVFKDLENSSVFERVSTFARDMREMRARLTQAKKLHYRYQAESWFVDAVEAYCQAVASATPRGRLSYRSSPRPRTCAKCSPKCVIA